jgi:triosephosphate isomerase
VHLKVLTALEQGITPIVAVGETLDERNAGSTDERVMSQMLAAFEGLSDADLMRVVIAYEPIWAIGTGLTPTSKDVEDMHGFIRRQLAARFGGTSEAVRILYGGSVKASNAAELLSIDNVDGALVGGASLNAEEFLAIAGVYR